MKQIRPIRNQRDRDAATREIERLMDKETRKKLTKAEAARLEVLATLVDPYESAVVQDAPPAHGGPEVSPAAVVAYGQ